MNPPTPWPYPFWIAHRGAGKLAPENTLAAFELGLKHGYAMFECDVKLSIDEQCFLLHDATLERTTNGTGAAGELTLAQLQQLDAGSWHSTQFAGQKLPTLADVAAFCQQNATLLNIEIKPTPGLEARTGTVVAKTAAQLWAKLNTPPLLSSFQIASLQAAQSAAPDLPRGLLVDALADDSDMTWLHNALALQCVAVIFNHQLWTAKRMQQAHQAGLKALCYTVNDEIRAQALIDMGIDGIITDRVDLFYPKQAL